MHDNLEHATQAVLAQRSDAAVSKDRKALARRVAGMQTTVPASGSTEEVILQEAQRELCQISKAQSQLGGPASSQRNSGKGGVAEVA